MQRHKITKIIPHRNYFATKKYLYMRYRRTRRILNERWIDIKKVIHFVKYSILSNYNKEPLELAMMLWDDESSWLMKWIYYSTAYTLYKDYFLKLQKWIIQRN